MSRHPIFITGYMASGKTTFGRALARRLGRRFIDLDFFLEQRFHTTVASLFAERGEEGFRRMESAALREVGEFEDVVISCGGGTPCFNGNMDYMNSRGVTVLMDTEEECILRRLIVGASKRPLMQGKSREEILATMRGHLSLRMPYYKKSKIRFSGDNLEDRRQISQSVEKFISSYGEEF